MTVLPDDYKNDNQDSDRKLKFVCSIAIILAIIGGVIYLFATETKESIAESGSILFIGLVIVSFFLLSPLLSVMWDKFKAKNEREGKYKKNKIGRIVALIVGIAIVIVIGVLSYNFYFTYVLGVIGTVGVAIALSVIIFLIIND